MSAPLKVKLGVARTVSAMVVEAMSAPEVPEMVTVSGPAIVAEDAAEKVTTCVPAVAPGAKLAVTPAGRPVAASVTAPVKPPREVTLIVLIDVAV